MSGKELTILQSLYLAAVLSPKSVGGLVELISYSISGYLNKGGVIVLHPGDFFEGQLSFGHFTPFAFGSVVFICSCSINEHTIFENIAFLCSWVLFNLR